MIMYDHQMAVPLYLCASCLFHAGDTNPGEEKHSIFFSLFHSCQSLSWRNVQLDSLFMVQQGNKHCWAPSKFQYRGTNQYSSDAI